VTNETQEITGIISKNIVSVYLWLSWIKCPERTYI